MRAAANYLVWYLAQESVQELKARRKSQMANSPGRGFNNCSLVNYFTGLCESRADTNRLPPVRCYNYLESGQGEIQAIIVPQ